jgi:hypothetical protein
VRYLRYWNTAARIENINVVQPSVMCPGESSFASGERQVLAFRLMAKQTPLIEPGEIMQSFYANYLSNLREFHAEIRTAVKGLPQNVLDWTSGADMNSLNVLVVHLIGAECYWIGDVIAGAASGRDRDSEFKVQGLSEDELVQKLSEIEIYIQEALEPFVLQSLDETRISPRNGREVTVGWALCHALKHTALHVGHIQITRQLWERQQSI